jgi:hypothetical protein
MLKIVKFLTSGTSLVVMLLGFAGGLEGYRLGHNYVSRHLDQHAYARFLMRHAHPLASEDRIEFIDTFGHTKVRLRGDCAEQYCRITKSCKCIYPAH